MADIKKPADLMHILPAQEKRLKKMERQLAVPRTDVSIVNTTETTNSPTAVALTTADTVTIVTTAVCLIHIYVVVTAKTTAGTCRVYLFDHDATAGAGEAFEILNTTSATDDVLATADFTSFGNVPSGTPITFPNTSTWTTAAGAHKFSLKYLTTSGTATFRNRKLFAWVQPF